MPLQINGEIPRIHYQLSMPRPHTHLLEVDVTFFGLNEDYLDLILPVWRPGRYVILDFAGGVQEFVAYSGEAQNGRNNVNGRLAWSKINKTTWRIPTRGNKTVTASYKVYANEFNLRTRGLDDRHAFIDGCAVFMYAEKFRRAPLTLQVHPYGDWHVTTGLDREQQKKEVFRAPNYDYLVDCPLEIGTQLDIEFTVQLKKHTLSIFGKGNWNPEKLVERLKKVVETNFEFWEELPYEHYTFMVHSTPNSGGGTEHLNSTIMGIRQFAFGKESGYDSFTSLAMHEFFHTWNVKQLRPAGIHPYDYTSENYSDLLWISEGATTYYTMMLMRRAGFTSVQTLFEQLENKIRNDRSRPGREIQTLAESSFDSWIKFWKDAPDGQNREVSYYDKGALVSLLLDLEIRHRTGNRASLDEVMRTLYRKFPLSGAGFTDADFRRTVEEIGEGNYAEFFSLYVTGTAEIDFGKFLGYVGLELEQVSPASTKVDIGISTYENDGRVFISKVTAGSSAYESGLNAGDELVAVEGYRVRGQQLSERLNDYQAGESIRVSVFRDEELRHFDVILRESFVPDFNIKHAKSPTDLQKKIYASWLSAPWPDSAD